MHKEIKVAVITGASSGLGLLMAIKLHKKGYKIYTCSRNNAKNMDVDFLSENVDVRNEMQVKDFIDMVMRRFGRIDILVNNAGYAYPKQAIEEATDEILYNSFETNVYGPFYFIRKVIPIMKKQGKGAIINIASKAAVYVNPSLALYSASKSALVALTQAIAKELRSLDMDIYCISVSPAGLNTKMREVVYGKEDAEKQMDPQTVADMIVKIIEERQISQEKVPQGSNIIIKGGNAIVKVMEDG